MGCKTESTFFVGVVVLFLCFCYLSLLLFFVVVVTVAAAPTGHMYASMICCRYIFLISVYYTATSTLHPCVCII